MADTSTFANILVIGNSTIDAYLRDDIAAVVRNEYEERNDETKDKNREFKRATVRLTGKEHEGSDLDFEIETISGPIQPGGKYTAQTDFSQIVDKVAEHKQPGGGGYNTAVGIRKIIQGVFAEFERALREEANKRYGLYYVDVSTPYQEITDLLRAADIAPHFLCYRQVPTNLILNSAHVQGLEDLLRQRERCDKIIIKQGLKKKVDVACLDVLEHEDIERAINSSSAVLINSLKDEEIAKLIVEKARAVGVPLYAVITTSLNSSFVLREIAPYATLIFNYDEFNHVLRGENISKNNVNGNENDKASIDECVAGLQFLRAEYCRDDQHRDGQHMIYVTLGRNGALCDDGRNIYHIRLKKEADVSVQEFLLQFDKTTCGAGDNFAAGILFYQQQGFTHASVHGLPVDVRDVTKKSCIAAVRYLGYGGVGYGEHGHSGKERRLSEDDFEIVHLHDYSKNRALAGQHVN